MRHKSRNPTAGTAPFEILGCLGWLGFAGSITCAGAARADETLALQPVSVNTRSADLVGTADTATEGSVTAKQLATRPLLRAAEVLESVPGMTVTQHSGDGKANQYFLRGFNLDHGSDFATWVNGMPINEVTHAHAQGYTDLNFLIPELVGRVAYRKGAYAADDGDFAVTGSARIDDLRQLDTPFVDLTGGSHGYRRLLAAGSRELGDDLRLLVAFEGATTNGPWEQPEHLHKLNGVLRLSSGTQANGFDLTAMAYSARWTSTEQVPERAIQSGEIGRYGTFAPNDGGITHRRSVSGNWNHSDEAGSAHAGAYLIDYGLNLFSTPSGLLDPQHEQADRRTTWGGSVARGWVLGPDWFGSEVVTGLQYREDRIPRLGLYLTQDRQRVWTVREDRVTERAIGAHAEARTRWLPWLRSTIGLRWDRLEGPVTSLGGDFNASNGGTVRSSQPSPKLALAVGPFRGTEFYGSWGRGFHSNDFRGATTTVDPADGSAVQRVPAMSRATTSEVGLRTSPAPGWNSALSLWTTTLASELVYVGDEGVTEPRGASRRRGIEWWNDWAPTSWLVVDADLALSRARFDQPVNSGTDVPNAIPRSASVGISADAQGAWFGGLRLRYIGAYPLEESGIHRSSGFATANLKIGYRIDRRWRVSLDVLNVLDRKAYDIEYWGASCTRAEGAGCNGNEGFDGKLVHPMEPRTFRLTLRANL